ncbi:hypothetical protein QTP88_021698 [Uroleucon formosanum]
MNFSKGFLAGISLGCVCVAGISFLFSRKNNPSTDEYELKNIKEDLEDDKDDQFFDAETGSYKSVTNENLNDVKQLKSKEVKKQLFRDLQHNFELNNLNCLPMKYHMSNAIQATQHTVDKQEITIKSLKLDMSDVRTNLNRLLESVDLLRAEKTSTERNTVKSDTCKIRRLKTRISILESEVAKNSSKMIGIDHTFLALSLTRLNSGAGAAAVSSAEEFRFYQNPPNAHCRQPATPTSSSSTLAGPPPVHPVPRSPPPPPPVHPVTMSPPPPPPVHPVPMSPPPPPTVTSGFGLPPPPPPSPPLMIMKTGTSELRSEFGKKTCASELAGPEKNATKTYGRIPITVEILKSVVLKPVVRRS